MRSKLALLAAVAAVVAIFAFGIVKPDSAWAWTRYVFYRGKGAVASFGSSSPAGNLEHARECRENLHRIQAAKRKAGQDRGNPIGAVTWEEVLRAMYPEKPVRQMAPTQLNALIPKCPDGGTYALDTLEAVPKCSIGGNNTLTLEDDHIIRD
jgi:hypothetical protein